MSMTTRLGLVLMAVSVVLALWPVGRVRSVLLAATSLLAALCWVPVVFIQIRMKRLLEASARGEAIDEAAYDRLFGKLFILGWPAFGGLVVIFWLMVTKPTW